jgi:hypothetical protein
MNRQSVPACDVNTLSQRGNGNLGAGPPEEVNRRDRLQFLEAVSENDQDLGREHALALDAMREDFSRKM